VSLCTVIWYLANKVAPAVKVWENASVPVLTKVTLHTKIVYKVKKLKLTLRGESTRK